MANEKLVENLNRLPVGLLALLFAGYLGYDYYSFTSSADSPLIQKQQEAESIKKSNVATQEKLKQASEFLRSLDQKKAELRKLAQDLSELKGTLSSEVDIASFMKTVVTEAKKVGLVVTSLKPASIAKKEYYEEQPFEMVFQGVYPQLLVFLERLSNLQNIIRVDDFEIRPTGSSASKYVELDGAIKIKTYKYLGSRADEIGKDGPGGAAAPASTPGSMPKKGSGS